MKPIVYALAILGLLSLTLAAPAWAGKKPSVKSCQELGMLEVACLDCPSGRFLGKASVQAQYDVQDQDCMARYKEARDRCSTAYGHPQHKTGVKWSYWMGVERFYGNYPKGCGK